MSKEIALANGQIAIVDDDDFERASRYTWCISQGKAVAYLPELYAIHGNPGKAIVLLHRFVLGMERGRSWRVQHINGNKLDNRKENLFDPKTCRQHSAEAGTRHIPLSPRLCAIVDASDFEWLSQ